MARALSYCATPLSQHTAYDKRTVYLVKRPEGGEEPDVLRQVGEEPEMVLSHGQYPEYTEDYQSKNGQSDDEHEETCRRYAQIVHAHPSNTQMITSDGYYNLTHCLNYLKFLLSHST